MAVIDMKWSNGFTLLEVIVSVVIMSVVAITVAQVFFSTTRSNTKSETSKDIKQNGNFALGLMERMIRNARSITISSCTDGSSPQPSILLENPDSGTTEFGCVSEGGVTRIASNSSSFLTSNTVSLGGTDCDSANLSFTCTLVGDKPGKIGISFKLSQKGNETDISRSSSTLFQSTITIRN